METEVKVEAKPKVNSDLKCFLKLAVYKALSLFSAFLLYED